jgi:hypothetical protein
MSLAESLTRYGARHLRERFLTRLEQFDDHHTIAAAESAVELWNAVYALDDLGLLGTGERHDMEREIISAFDRAYKRARGSGGAA